VSARDVFVSYSSDDHAAAMDVCAHLEQRGLQCWIASRDIPSGAEWDEAIVEAVETSRALVVLLSARANESPFVKTEVSRAFSRRVPVFTFRIEDVLPARSLDLYLTRRHWTDGFPGPVGQRLDRLADGIGLLFAERLPEVVVRKTNKHLDGPLVAAAEKGHEETVRTLLDLGADPDARAGDRKTALMMAAYEPHPAVAMLLLERGADVNAAADSNGNTALMLAADAGTLQVFEDMLRRGADFTAVANDGTTVLMKAAAGGNVEIVERLIHDCRVDVNARNQSGATALHHIYSWRTNPSVGGFARMRWQPARTHKPLLAAGADVNARDKYGQTCLNIVVRREDVEAVTDLLSYDAEVNLPRLTVPINPAPSPLIDAARTNNGTAIIEILLARRADADAQDNSGKTAAIHAAERGMTAMVLLLARSRGRGDEQS